MQIRDTYLFFRHQRDENSVPKFVENFLVDFFSWRERRKLILTPWYPVDHFNTLGNIRESAFKVSSALNEMGSKGVLKQIDNILQSAHVISCSYDDVNDLVEKSFVAHNYGRKFLWYLWKQEEHLFRCLVELIRHPDYMLVGYLSVPVALSNDVEERQKNDIRVLLNDWLQCGLIDDWRVDWEHE